MKKQGLDFIKNVAAVLLVLAVYIAYDQFFRKQEPTSPAAPVPAVIDKETLNYEVNKDTEIDEGIPLDPEYMKEVMASLPQNVDENGFPRGTIPINTRNMVNLRNAKVEEVAMIESAATAGLDFIWNYNGARNAKVVDAWIDDKTFSDGFAYVIKFDVGGKMFQYYLRENIAGDEIIEHKLAEW